LATKYGSNGKAGEQNNPIYAGMIERVDQSVGRIVKKLEDLRLTERTVIFFTSDNGGLSVREGPNTPSTTNAPFREGKGYLYEGGIRAPLLVKWPGVAQPGAECSVPVSSVDFFPTILEMCGVRREARSDGLSFAPLLRRHGLTAREALYWHYPHYSNQGGKPGGAVRAGDFKLIEFYESGRRELYDLKADVSESHNLIEEKSDVGQDLAAKLQRWRQEVGAKIMRPNPAYVPNPQAADGTVTLPARTADVHGVQLRYEPAPHKNTLGYWTLVEDWASWEFQLVRPGAFTVELLQGCGEGQGGSSVQITVGRQSLKMIVEDTAHFQNFKAYSIGTVRFDQPGRYTLTVKPQSRRGFAVMDLREVKLKPAGK
jgi:arylsulfatase A